MDPADQDPLAAGGRVWLRKDYHTIEQWVVLRGTAEVTVCERLSLFHPNEAN